jgi:hypothetical protein
MSSYYYTDFLLLDKLSEIGTIIMSEEVGQSLFDSLRSLRVNSQSKELRNKEYWGLAPSEAKPSRGEESPNTHPAK